MNTTEAKRGWGSCLRNIALLAAIAFGPFETAQAITLAPSYDLSGTIVFGGFAQFNLTNSSALVLFENGDFSLVGEVKDTSNRSWQFNLDLGDPVGGLGSNTVELRQPANDLMGTIAPQFDFHVGGKKVKAGTELNVFTRGPRASLTQSGVLLAFKDWWKIDDYVDGKRVLNAEYFADPGFKLTPLPGESSEIPEPFSMSLLALGLAGGLAVRRGAKEAEQLPERI